MLIETFYSSSPMRFFDENKQKGIKNASLNEKWVGQVFEYIQQPLTAPLLLKISKIWNTICIVKLDCFSIT